MSVMNHTVRLEDHPSYLKWFGTGAVRLIYSKKLSISSNSEDGNLSSGIDLEASVENCDLTGQPLSVDLDDSNNAIESLAPQRNDHIWPKDELRHYPLPVREARKILNRILREGNVGVSQPYYALCAGDDRSKTVLLGANVSDFMGCSVQLLEPLPACKVESNLENMVLEHLRNCFNNNSQVKYLVKMSYNVYGRNVPNTTDDQQVSKLLVDGNISVDITALEKIFRPRKNSAADVKMNVSVFVGHPLLKLNFIWQQLLKLQRIFSILSDSNFENKEEKFYETISLSDASLDMDSILQSLTNLVSIKEFCPIRKKDVVNLNDLRHLNILDRLWDILSCCGNVAELNDSFSFLFSELLKVRSNICLMDVSDNIGILIKRMLEGHREMPKSSVKQSLEFLFELGARKLKLDLQTIISQFPDFDKAQMDFIWKSFSATPPLRTTTFNKSAVQMQEQLAYLCQLYVASELFYLVKDQVKMSEDGQKLLCKSIEHEYIFDKSKITDFNESFTTPLRSIQFNLDLNYASFIDNMLPSQWTLTMESGNTTTIYHLSSQPIYPPQIKFDVDVPHPDVDGPLFYVTKMNRSYTKLW